MPDPNTIAPDDADQMTHWAPQPNPVHPIVNAIAQYLQSGIDLTPAHNPGTVPADYLKELLRDPDIMQKNIEQASNFNFGGIMGGVGAKGADLAAHATAQEMEKAGAKQTDIWNKTGWFKGKDDQWRFEIPDAGSSFVKTPAYGSKSTDTMQDVLAHPELYAAYPELAEMQAYRMSPRVSWTGEYSPPGVSAKEGIGLNTRYPDEDPRTVLIHELQHAVQRREGFDRGGMPNINQNDPKYRGVFQNYDDPWAEIYRRSYGETEARSAERRQDWSARQRQRQPPWVTQSKDVPLAQQILSVLSK